MYPFNLQAVTPIRLVRHAPGAPELHWLGLGPHCCPSKALLKLQRLFDRHAHWARVRSFNQLRRLLACSDALMSLWPGNRLVAFRRATSEIFSRAMLWDNVVAGDLQGRGLCRRVLEELLHSPSVTCVKRVYLMTANSAGFYRKLGFRDAGPQQLLVLKR